MRFVVLRLIVVIGAFVAACAESKTPEPVGGETHFLHACDGTDSCGLGLDCVCGVCTATCLTDNSCKDQSALATCEAAGTPSGACDNPQASPVCDVQCDLDADCSTLGSPYTCESGSCRKLATGSCVAGGVIYADGHQYSVDGCNTCTCNNGNFSCTDLVCGDSGMDAAVDAGVDATIIPEPACEPGDGDAGGPDLTLLTETPTCPAATDVVQAPGVEVVAIGDGATTPFAVTDTDVYWGRYFAGLRRAEIGTSNVWAFDMVNNVEAYQLVVDGCRVYWANGFPIQSVLTGGGDVRFLSDNLSPNEYIQHLALDAQHIYASTPRGLYRVPRSGGMFERLRSLMNINDPAPPILLLGDRVLWVESDGVASTRDSTILSVPKDRSRTPTTFASGLANPVALASDGTHVYIGNDGTTDTLGNPNADRSLMRVPLTGGAPEVWKALTHRPFSLAVDATHVYWVELTATTYNLWRAPKDASQATLIASDITGYFALSATHVYWSAGCGLSVGDAGFIARIPKESL